MTSTVQRIVGRPYRLCKLDIEDGDFDFEVAYGDRFGELSALTRRSWVCGACVSALLEKK